MSNEKKKISEWAFAMGYKVVEHGPLIKKYPGILDRDHSQEEVLELLKTEPLLRMEKLPDGYSLSEEDEENVRNFFREAEQSLHTKSWEQLAHEMEGIAKFIRIKHDQKNGKKEETPGTGTGETS